MIRFKCLALALAAMLVVSCRADLALAQSKAEDSNGLVREIISADGIHVVHFWSPFSRETAEGLRKGWYELIENNGDVSFTFIAVAASGSATAGFLEQFVPLARIHALSLRSEMHEHGEAQEFLGHRLTHVPSTWIFSGGECRAFALEAGALGLDEIQPLIDVLRSDGLGDLSR